MLIGELINRLDNFPLTYSRSQDESYVAKWDTQKEETLLMLHTLDLDDLDHVMSSVNCQGQMVLFELFVKPLVKGFYDIANSKE